jgi:hypothetical protein
LPTTMNDEQERSQKRPWNIHHHNYLILFFTDHIITLIIS